MHAQKDGDILNDIQFRIIVIDLRHERAYFINVRL